MTQRAAPAKAKKGTSRKRAAVAEVVPAEPVTAAFAEVVDLIEQARRRAYLAVNTELMDLYWQIGQYISRKLETAEWGDSVVDGLAQHLGRTLPGVRGFSRQNLFRMRQLYETYRGEAIVSPLVRQLPWTHNLIILGQSKRAEERAFYVRMAVRERWSKRELQQQFIRQAFERAVLRPAKRSPSTDTTHPAAASVFKDAYLVEFLDLPQRHSEADLHQGLLRQLRDFLVELGRDFCFVGSEYPVQVGGRDFALDLLFFHRGLNCLVAIELKVTEFEPEHLGKLSFYLEALDRDHKKPRENPAIGMLLCASRNHEVVEYALSRTLSPALVAAYETQLPDRKMLEAKLHEFAALNESREE